jgi:hypothetical protein
MRCESDLEPDRYELVYADRYGEFGEKAERKRADRRLSHMRVR